MSVWRKLVTAVKGGATEAAQSVADSQAIRILEQEIREAKDELRKSDHARTQILAKCKHGVSTASQTKLAEELCELFLTDNERFDSEKFLEACDL
jgi:phage shock protein A